ncbi:MAG TPA: sialidase family protein, partial [Actinomycetes bacterium]|nr:sialidase family protein [Actinomycetes bacterium]
SFGGASAVALGDADDPVLRAPPVDTAPGPEYADDTRIFQGIPGIERAENGRLWALWYAGGPDEPGEGPGNYVVLVTSGDDGRTWSAPKLVVDPPGPVRAYDPCLWHDPQGRLWLFWAQSYQWWDGRSGVWAIVTENSDQESPRWSPPRRLCDGIMMNKPTVLSSGEWLLPTAVWERKANANIPPALRHDLGERSGANVMVSTDQGATWTYRGQALVPNRVFDEHMIVERGDGSLRMLVRAAYGIGESFSPDRGATWSPGRRSEISHVNARFFIRRLSSGKLLLVTHNPPDTKTRSHLTARLSGDDGKTWQGGLMIDERPGVSYPDGVQSPDGAIYLIYDYQRTGDKQILMATFTEADVLAGEWSSTVARQRVVVNQATGVRGSKKVIDLALKPPVVNTSPGAEYSDEARDVNMVLGMDRTPGGRIWAGWISGGDSELGYFVAATSDDNGESWSRPRLVIDPADAPTGLPRRSLVGNFWTDPNGRLWLFFDQSMGFFDGRAGAWAITCDNPDADRPTWSPPRRIWHGATLNKPIVLDGGDWLMPISLWSRGMIRASTEKRRETFDPKSIPRDFKDRFRDLDDDRMAHVFASADGGQTWTRRGGVTFPRFNFDEHILVEVRDGRLWMLARTLDGIFESYSADQGRTWTPPRLRFPHIPARFFLRRLTSGRLLVVKHGRIDQRTPSRSHLTAFLSDDDGKTWQGGLMLDERTGVSYPDGFQAPDGMIYILYDRNRYTDAEILLARFREQDVLESQWSSPGSRQRMLVNQAKGERRQ